MVLACGLAACHGPRLSKQSVLPTEAEQAAPAAAVEGTGDEHSMSTWEQAEAAASAYLEDKHGVAPVGVASRHEVLPFLLGMWVTQDVGEMVLVSREGVVTARGVEALGDYLEGVAFLKGPAVPVGDMLVLVQHLDAWPPLGDPQKRRGYFVSAGVRPDLDPTFTQDPGGASLTLHYEHVASPPALEGLSIGAEGPPPASPSAPAAAPPPPVGAVGGSAMTSVRRFQRWTLDIGPDYAVAWVSESVVESATGR